MQNFIRENKWLMSVKITAALFQIPATWNVFVNIFKEAGRPLAEVYITSFFAILLIDAFFLAVLYLLESAELSPYQKLPWALVGVGLMIATLLIGLKDEGSFAWMPRLGFLGLVSADLFVWVTDVVAYWFDRDQVERRLRNKQVIKRRKIMLKAWQQAIKDLYPDLVTLQVQREIRTLNLSAEEPPIPPESAEQIVDMNLTSEPIQVEEGIYKDAKGYFWKSPITGEVFYDTSLGKPYTLRGARLARSRHIKSQEENAW